MMTATVSQKFDSILSEIGGFGRYQVFQYILLILAVVYTSAATVAYVFTAGYVPHRCLVEVCGDENEASTFLPPWWKDAIPPTSEGEPSTCTTYVPLNLTSTVTPGTSTPESTDTCPLFNKTLEFVSPKRRELGGAVIVWSYTLGMIWLSFVAWAVREWNKILLVVYAPALLFISFIWLIPESVRWLMLRGRFGDAKQLIQRMAAVNHNKISDSLKSELATWENGVAPYGVRI
ncbi:hypothetical protein B566_EDAN011799 [Ephemera danica]|nr:hypothetical protein B566_EDAN011799 [Ephemera danica]